MKYDYRCRSCDHEWEAEQKISDMPITECPFCGQQEAKRLISKTSFVLQGRGWFKDGYANG